MKPEKELEQIYKEFGKGLKEVAEKHLDDAIMKYIPYADTDFYMNVEYRAKDWLEKFFNGDDDEYITNPVLSEFSCEEAREKIYQAHKEEIAELIGKDKDKEIERLKSELDYARKSPMF